MKDKNFKQDFLSQLENDFIPAIERMILKEQNHLKWLNKKLLQAEQNVCKKGFSIKAIYTDLSTIRKYIKIGKNALNHLNDRLEEYGQYLESNKTKNKTTYAAGNRQSDNYIYL